MSEIIESLDDSLIVIEDSSKKLMKSLELNSAVQETVSALQEQFKPSTPCEKRPIPIG